MIHVLDTSAVLAHDLDEPGAEQVEFLLVGGPGEVVLPAPVWVELDRRPTKDHDAPPSRL